MKTKILKGGVKMKNKTLGIFGILAISLFAVSMVFAYQGDPNVQGPNHSEERHDAMQDAFDSGSYQDWYDLMTENGMHPKIVDVITAENFDEFVAARNAALNGDLDALKEFRDSLGLGLGQMKHGNGETLAKGQGKGFGRGQGNFHFANSE